MKFKLLKSYYACTIIAILLANQNLIAFPTGVTELMMVGYIILSSYHDQWRIKLHNTPVSQYVWFGWIVPSVIIWVYSIAIQLWYGLSSDYLVHTTTYCVRSVLYTLFAVSNVKIHKEKTIDTFLHACTVSYIPAWTKFLGENGISGSLALLLSDNVFAENIALEVHTLTYLLGFIFVYYFYQLVILKMPVLNKVIHSLVLTIAGMKRIVLASLLFIVLLIIFLSLFKEKKCLHLINIASTAMVFVALGYVAVIKTGILEAILQVLNIDDNFRFNFWNHFQDRYSLSPLFPGFGISYAHRILAHEWSQIQNLKNAANIHNDILGIYLGLGFLGSNIYWWMFFRKRYQILKKTISISSATFSTVISIFYFIIMMTSNEGMMEFPHSIYFLMIYMCAIYGKNDEMKQQCMEER